MAFGASRKDSTLNRHDNVAHPLPLPPTKNMYMEMMPTSEHLQGGLPSNTSTPVPSSSSTILYGSEKPPISIQTGWRKGSVLGTGSFGQVYMGFNRCLFIDLSMLSIDNCCRMLTIRPPQN